MQVTALRPAIEQAVTTILPPAPPPGAAPRLLRPIRARRPAGCAGAGLLAAVEASAVMALQPVVETGSGAIMGVEALLRGHDALGFAAPPALLGAAAAAGVLGAVERVAIGRAIDAFAQLPGAAEMRLFVNLDARTLAEDRAGLADELPAMMRAAGLPASALCIELSDRQTGDVRAALAAKRLAALRMAGVRVAADNYGVGAASASMLFDQPLDYLKVDRMLVNGVGRDQRRRLFLGSVVRFGRMLGLQVVAEGVEEEADLLVCRELGCDLVQGWLPGRPSLDPALLVPVAAGVAEAIARDQRRPASRRPNRVLGAAESVPAVHEDTPVEALLEMFRRDRHRSAIPVVDAAETPLGVVLEATLRDFSYGSAGARGRRGRRLPKAARHFITRCPVADLHSDLEAVLQLAASNPDAPGVILADQRRYRAWLPVLGLLSLTHERRLASALEQNPLTRLPGNRRVAEEVALAAAEQPGGRLLCWFDFEAFKPFNDRFGFRIGDRAIMLFAEALQRHLPPGPGCFLGHVGGDDFFGSFLLDASGEVERRIAAVLAEFRDSAALFYTAEERAAAACEMRDREGRLRRVPLLRCSAAMLHLPPGTGADPDALSGAIAAAKAAAKRAPDGIARRIWDGRTPRRAD